MNKLNLKLKLNKIYERQLLMRRKLWDMEETINAIEKLHKDNYDAVELLLDILSNDMKKPDVAEINGKFKELHQVTEKKRGL
tara:strand:- start:219 stop:464 length:246 start_codon:yes stop_codon:yes gene_type:complete